MDAMHGPSGRTTSAPKQWAAKMHIDLKFTCIIMVSSDMKIDVFRLILVCRYQSAVCGKASRISARKFLL
jgi:hypothetical protein